MQTNKPAPTPPAPPKLTPLQVAIEYFNPHQLSEDQQNRVESLRKAAKTFVESILANTKPCADQTAAIRKLRECQMTLVQAISLEEVGK